MTTTLSKGILDAPTIQNTLYTNDNLFVLNGLNSSSVDLIYLDPPFNSKRTYSAPIGSKAAGASFKDMWGWEDVDESYLDKLVVNHPELVRFIETIQQTHSKAMMAYITYMTQRIIELHRILKDTGSIYLHCDPTASHYLKIMMDTIFGKENFRNEIVWNYTGNSKPKTCFPKKHDIIFLYSKSNTYFFTPIVIPYAEGTIKRYNHIDKDGRKYKISALRNGIQEKVYMSDGKFCDDVFSDIPVLRKKSERLGYPTQKPLELLRRILEASSKKGDIVLDPFCGCATTCVAAEKLGRQWIGIDIEAQASKILVERLSDTAGAFIQNFIHRTDTPQRTDIKTEPITLTIKELLFKEQKGACNGCGTEFNIQNFEVDHIIPKSKGGGDYYENYQLLCGNCNRTKGARPMEYLRAKIKSREALLKNKLTFGE